MITFKGPKSARAWIFGTKEGKAILAEIRNEIREEIQQEQLGRSAVLIEYRWDRVTVWGDKEVDVSLCLRPIGQLVNEWNESWTLEDDIEEDAIEKSFRESIVPRPYRYLLAQKPRKTAMLTQIREFDDVLEGAARMVVLSEIHGNEYRVDGRKMGLVI
jgi:hypothetical protein